MKGCVQKRGTLAKRVGGVEMQWNEARLAAATADGAHRVGCGGQQQPAAISATERRWRVEGKRALAAPRVGDFTRTNSQGGSSAPKRSRRGRARAPCAAQPQSFVPRARRGCTVEYLHRVGCANQMSLFWVLNYMCSPRWLRGKYLLCGKNSTHVEIPSGHVTSAGVGDRPRLCTPRAKIRRLGV